MFADLHLVQLPYHPSPISYDVSATSASMGTAGGAWSTTLTVPTNTLPDDTSFTPCVATTPPASLPNTLARPFMSLLLAADARNMGPTVMKIGPVDDTDRSER